MTMENLQQAISSRSGETSDVSSFFSRGFLDPVPFLSEGQCDLLFTHLTPGKPMESAPWSKGRAVTDRLLYDIANSPRLISILRQLLGEDIILWGASSVDRTPGQVHPWHVDMESAAPEQRFATVWIGLRNTSRDSGLTFVSRSHMFPSTVQEVQHREQVRRGDATDEQVLAWAREFDPLAELVQPDVSNGEAVIFDGRIWHGSRNNSASGTRRALLLRYASADAPVFKPDPSAPVEWPFRFDGRERPPVIVVSGKANDGVNREMPPPPTSPEDATRIETEVRPITVPLEGNARVGWRPHKFFRGLTEVHDLITCHASVLSPGKIPHPPHSHLEEEILIVLDGEAELLIGDGPEVERATVHPAKPGMFAYYPAYQHHTIRNAGQGPLTYLMFKWRGAPVHTDTVLSTSILDPSDHPPGRPKPFRSSLLAEGPTNFLGKLHVHYSEVDPGAGYEPHRDDYDVAIVVLSGTIETLGQEVEPFGVVYYAANELHGLRGKGAEPARYLVFEFHASQDNGAARTKTTGAIPFAKNSLYTRGRKLVQRHPALQVLFPRPVKNLLRNLLR